MAVTIVIPSHNRADLLAACLQSILVHRTDNLEILVVDDASPNGSAARAAGSYRGVRVLRLAERRGFCAAANAGIHAAETTFVQLLNDDTEVTAGWINAALAVFRDHPEVAAIAPLVLCWPDGERIDSAGDEYYLGGVARKRGRGQSVGPQYLQPGYVFGAGACGAFYRREALLAVGAFPEEFGAYFDDIDLSFRLRRAGYQVWYEPTARILHHGSASYGQASGDLLRQQSRNEERVFWRNIPASKLASAIPKHLAVLAAKGYRRWQEGNLVPFLQGRWDAAIEAHAIQRHRRRLRIAENPHAECFLSERWWETSRARQV